MRNLFCEFFTFFEGLALKSFQFDSLAFFINIYLVLLCMYNIRGEFYKEYADRDDKGFRQTVGGRMQRDASRCAPGQSSMCAMHITFIGRERSCSVTWDFGNSDRESNNAPSRKWFATVSRIRDRRVCIRQTLHLEIRATANFMYRRIKRGAVLMYAARKIDTPVIPRSATFIRK